MKDHGIRLSSGLVACLLAAMAGAQSTNQDVLEGVKKISEGNREAALKNYDQAIQLYAAGKEQCAGAVDITLYEAFSKAQLGEYTFAYGLLNPRVNRVRGKALPADAALLAWIFEKTDRAEESLALLRAKCPMSAVPVMEYGLPAPTSNGTAAGDMAIAYFVASRTAPRWENGWFYEKWLLEQALAKDPTNAVVKTHYYRKSFDNLQSPEEKSALTAAVKQFYATATAEQKVMIKQAMDVLKGELN